MCVEKGYHSMKIAKYTSLIDRRVVNIVQIKEWLPKWIWKSVLGFLIFWKKKIKIWVTAIRRHMVPYDGATWRHMAPCGARLQPKVFHCKFFIFSIKIIWFYSKAKLILQIDFLKTSSIFSVFSWKVNRPRTLVIFGPK